MPTRRRHPPGLHLTPAQTAALRRAERLPHTRAFRSLVAVLEQAVRLAGELAGDHEHLCSCPVCCSANPVVAAAAVAATRDLCNELLSTLADTTGGGTRTARPRKAA